MKVDRRRRWRKALGLVIDIGVPAVVFGVVLALASYALEAFLG